MDFDAKEQREWQELLIDEAAHRKLGLLATVRNLEVEIIELYEKNEELYKKV